MSAPSIEALKETLQLVDSVSQDTFSRIKSICQVALLAMEQHGRPVDIEDLAQILRQIEQASDEAENFINSQAEGGARGGVMPPAGCLQPDAGHSRRVLGLLQRPSVGG